ncbi:hypothetical protein AB0B31_04005 [Catellatospora citrea]|uniref:hypothetical protein n=1 Tax=Catellatospora citrea TaxID=53366 RepID=UPI0033EE60D5
MNKTIAGLGLAGTLFWTVGIIAQFADESLYRTGDILIWIGFTGIAAFIVGLLRSGAAGRGLFAKIALGVWALGHLCIAIGGVVQDATGDADNPFYPIGGLGQIVGGFASAIVIARAGVLTGWRRWAPLAWAITYLGMFAALVSAGDNPPTPLIVPFLVWLAAIAATCVGFATAPSAQDRVTAVA